LLVERGAAPFREALANAVDALDFKLNQVLARESANGVEGARRVVDAVLGIMALAPEMPGQAGQVKRELIVTRIAHRLGLREETVWARFGELKRAQATKRQPDGPARTVAKTGERKATAPTVERELLEVLLAEPALVRDAVASVGPDEVSHPGLRNLLEGLYDLHRQGEPPDLDGLRARLTNPDLVDWALSAQQTGRNVVDRPAWFAKIVAAFRDKRSRGETKRLQSELTGVDDHATAVELLRKLQNRTAGTGPVAP
jgi:DNA primase